MTTLQKITSLNWFDFLRKIKEILLDIIASSVLEAQIESTSASSFTITPTGNIIIVKLTGTTTNVQLPTVLGNEGLIIFFKNAGSGTSNINSNTGSNDIWDGGIQMNTLPILSGTGLRLINDGTNYSNL